MAFALPADELQIRAFGQRGNRDAFAFRQPHAAGNLAPGQHRFSVRTEGDPGQSTICPFAQIMRSINEPDR
jgi:hypothetical protein